MQVNRFELAVVLAFVLLVAWSRLDFHTVALEPTGLAVTGADVDAEVLAELGQADEARVIIIYKEDDGRFGASAEESEKQRGERRLLKTKEILSGLDSNEFVEKHAYSGIAGFSGKVTRQGLAKLRLNPSVEKIYWDWPVEASLTTTVPLINADDVQARQIGGVNITGAGQTICIVDTGIDYTHPSLGGCLGSGCKVLGGYDFVNLDNDPMDDNSHGTHVAGIAAANGSVRGVSPGAKLVALKVLNAAGSGFESDVVAGIDWCRNNATLFNISVISLSLGGGSYSAACDTNPDAAAVNSAFNAGIFVSAASGNSFSSTAISSPACASNATAVAASDNSNAMASFSNTNSLVDLVAPGVSVTSTVLNGATGAKSGTSMATPHVAGAAALLQHYQRLQSGASLTPAEIKEILQRETSVRITDSDNSLTFSRIDALQAINSILIVNQTESSIRSSTGKIDFVDTVNLSGASGAFVIGNNSIFLNSSRFPEFNRSATLQFFNLSFEKSPIVLRDGSVCLSPECNITAYSGGNFSFVVGHFTNFTSGANSQLGVWDEGDSGQPYFDGTPRTGEPVSFFANYTNITSGSPISTAACNITTTASPTAMTFNASRSVFEHVETFLTSQFFTYSVVCTHASFETLTTTDTIQILSNSSGCTFPGANVNWTIENQTVICADENILLENQSINVRNATLVLDNTTLTLSQENSEGFNFLVHSNARLVADKSILKSQNAEVTFRLDINGSANITNSQIINGSKVSFLGNSTNRIINTLFNISLVQPNGNSTNVIDNSTFAHATSGSTTILNVLGSANNIISNSRFLNGTRFQGASRNTIINSSFANDTRFTVDSINFIQNSVLGNDTQFLVNSNSAIQNTTIGQLTTSNSPIINFTNITGGSNNVTIALRLAGTPTIHGFVNMPANISVFLASAEVNRFFPIFVFANGTSSPLAGKSVNLTNATGALVANGTTDANGLVILNVTFTDTTFGIGNFSVATNPTEPIGLLADTPIILQVPDTDSPVVTLQSPANATAFSSGLLLEFVYQASDASSGLANCSLIINGGINQTEVSPPENTDRTFILNIGEGSHTWQVNCTDDSAEANVGSSELRNFTVDSTKPSVSFVAPTPANNTFTNASQTINATASDINFANISIIVNSSVVRVCNASPCNFTVTGEGIYSYNATANDTAGNRNSTETRLLTIDLTPPELSFAAPTPANNTLSNTSRTINATASDQNLDRIRIIVNGSTVATCSSSPCNFTLTAGGNYSYFAIANDTAGNHNQTGVQNLEIDLTPPSVSFVAPTPANNTFSNVSQNINVTASDSVGLSSIRILVNGTLNRTCSSSPCNLTITADGDYSYFAFANDTAGNSNATEIRNLTLDMIVPQWSSNLTNATDNVTRNGNSVFFNITLNDNRAGGFQTFRYFNGTAFASDAADAWSGTTLQEARTITATRGQNVSWQWVFNDSAGNGNATALFNVTIGNAPPVWTTVANQSWSEDTNLTLNLSSFVSDADGDDINWTFVEPANMTIILNNDTGIVTFIPEANFSGTRFVVFNASDGITSALSNNITLTVTDAADCGNAVCESSLGETCSACSADCGSCPSPPPPSSGGGGGGGGGGSLPASCVENWSCTAWGECIGGSRSRACTDLNGCNATASKPAESEACQNSAPAAEQPSSAASTSSGGSSSANDNQTPILAIPFAFSIPMSCGVAWIWIVVAFLAILAYFWCRHRFRNHSFQRKKVAEKKGKAPTALLAVRKRWDRIAKLPFAAAIIALILALLQCPDILVFLVAILLGFWLLMLWWHYMTPAGMMDIGLEANDRGFYFLGKKATRLAVRKGTRIRLAIKCTSFGEGLKIKGPWGTTARMYHGESATKEFMARGRITITSHKPPAGGLKATLVVEGQ
jgi:subtilisin family serine protease